MAMPLSDYIELMQEINEKHGWNKIYPNVKEGRKIVKYVSSNFDTRVSLKYDTPKLSDCIVSAETKTKELTSEEKAEYDRKIQGELYCIAIKLYDVSGEETEKIFTEDECTKENILKFLEKK